MSEEEIVNKHSDFHRNFDIELPISMQKLPPLHWTPKIHKTPTGSRFIIGSKMSSLKPIGKIITKIFKVVFKMKRGYYRKAGFFSGLKQFWPIDNHNEILETLSRLNSKNCATSISTFDFSTLYTKIPHDKLIDVLSNSVSSIFNDTNRKTIAIGNKRAYFVKSGTKNHKLQLNDIIKCVDFLVNNAYFRVGKSIYRQIIGIPMGSDPAPFFANLFLSHYEAKWIKDTSRNNYPRSKRLFNVFRYIDDLVSLNDKGEFERSHPEIYPPELVLNKENIDAKKASYLDLDIAIQQNKFEYQIYDKRNSYNFKIVRFPFYDSNLPAKMFYSSISAEILRICRASSKSQSFFASCSPFIERMLDQGANVTKMSNSISNTIGKHFTDFNKYNMEKRLLIQNLFN